MALRKRDGFNLPYSFAAGAARWDFQDLSVGRFDLIDRPPRATAALTLLELLHMGPARPFPSVDLQTEISRKAAR